MLGAPGPRGPPFARPWSAYAILPDWPAHECVERSRVSTCPTEGLSGVTHVRSEGTVYHRSAASLAIRGVVRSAEGPNALLDELLGGRAARCELAGAAGRSADPRENQRFPYCHPNWNLCSTSVHGIVHFRPIHLERLVQMISAVRVRPSVVTTLHWRRRLSRRVPRENRPSTGRRRSA